MDGTVSMQVGHGPQAAARLERLPVSGYHKMIFFIIALAFFFDSIDLGMMTFVLGSIKTEFGLSTQAAGALASMSFVGMVLGAAMSGMLADRFGRKPVFQISMIIWGVASYLCSTAPDATTLGLYRFLLGLGMGMEFPVAQTLMSEFIPAKARGRYVALMDGFWPLGFITAGLISYFVLSSYNWRSVFVVLAIPALFLLVVRRFIPESPRWLEHVGRHEEAEATLEKFESKVKRSLKLQVLPEPLWSIGALPSGSTSRKTNSFMALWSPQHRTRTIMIWGLWFFALLGFYGLTTWLGALLQQGGFAVTKSVLYTVVISLGGIPGFLTAAWLVEKWGRKPTCIASLLGGALMAYLYGKSAMSGHENALIASGLCMQFFLFGMWAVLYTYTPELYSTGVRATGSGFASAIGRVGSLLGPYAVGVVLPTWGQGGVFTVGALCFVVAAALVFFLGIETRGLALEELSAD
ncbi:MFS transporter [Glaciimonas sp. CA11.2]|uniref:MFS transporter n=1 Tax=unclassified Glaciimonas TaxID=2644401 RepID=UPI002AB3EF02|nr:MULTISPECIES: MFS transporter [unclassified Glaciimonas]MDY7546825.1 MFS transporter [Glaciimonas sp. CA11.2]MEB0012294.1 MFS transporter [Glaciimonas sp. Cout2]MEB0080519.1 MFS transporter [Glaciimonas sp. Gout2]MEB0163407.1 MFS transporter [Glaciimonas sp. CA11.2]